MDEDLELSLETLDQWETELDQFAATIMKRLSSVTGKSVDMRGLIPQSQQVSADGREPMDDANGGEAMQLLRALRNMTQ